MHPTAQGGEKTGWNDGGHRSELQIKGAEGAVRRAKGRARREKGRFRAHSLSNRHASHIAFVVAVAWLQEEQQPIRAMHATLALDRGCAHRRGEFAFVYIMDGARSGGEEFGGGGDDACAAPCIHRCPAYAGPDQCTCVPGSWGAGVLACRLYLSQIGGLEVDIHIERERERKRERALELAQLELSAPKIAVAHPLHDCLRCQCLTALKRMCRPRFPRPYYI